MNRNLSIAAIIIGGWYMWMAVKAMSMFAIIASSIWIIMAVISMANNKSALKILKWLAILNMVEGLYIFSVKIATQWKTELWPMTLILILIGITNLILMVLFDRATSELKENQIQFPLLTVAILMIACTCIFHFIIFPSEPTADTIKASVVDLLKQAMVNPDELDELIAILKVDSVETEGIITKAYIDDGTKRRLDYFSWQNGKWKLINYIGEWDDETCKQVKIPESLWPSKNKTK